MGLRAGAWDTALLCPFNAWPCRWSAQTGEMACSRLESPGGNATAFKIRRKMFVAEQNLRQPESCGKGRQQPFAFIFAHSLHVPRLPLSSLSQRLTLPSPAVTGHCCIGSPGEDGAAQGECRKMWGEQDSRPCSGVCLCPAQPCGPCGGKCVALRLFPFLSWL